MTTRDLSIADHEGWLLHSQRNRFAETQFALMEEEEVRVNVFPALVLITFVVLMCALLGYYGRDLFWLVKEML